VHPQNGTQSAFSPQMCSDGRLIFASPTESRTRRCGLSGALCAVTLAVSANEADDRPAVDQERVAPERTKKPVKVG
jgi:hypothetical protein